jgi:hypothetical protein
MNMLAPLYILGIAAVAAPIVLHLIRRTPRGEVPFSSLMFLSPTPPRLTRRSRLDQWLLLLLRAAALSLLAIAFARPFLRQAAFLTAPAQPLRRVALVVDSSASMRREDLWAQALNRARQTIDALGPADQLAIFTFDTTTRPLLSFAESASIDQTRRGAVAKDLLNKLSPTWGASNLGQALVDAVTAVEEVADRGAHSSQLFRQLVVVSDLQQGSRLDSLGDFEWPSDVTVDFKTVSARRPNAGLNVVAATDDADKSTGGPGLRLRIVNETGASQDRFQIAWIDARGETSSPGTEFYVPAGESRIVHMPRPTTTTSGHGTLGMTGDGCDFDNRVYVVDDREDVSNVVYLGSDAADDSSGLLYYLNRVFAAIPGRSVTIAATKPDEALGFDQAHPPALVIVATDKISASRLRNYAQAGGTLAYVVRAAGPARALAEIADVAPWEITEGAVRGDLMLSEIAFDHPLFAPLAAAQFNDFTKIHFWKYRQLDPARLGDSRVLARFENGDVAILEKTLGKGRLVVMTTGWQPAESELARSSKFVPLLFGLLERREVVEKIGTRYLVQDTVPIPASERGTGDLFVSKPDGKIVEIQPGSKSFTDADAPGLYTLTSSELTRTFAVNLDPSESKTAPLEIETLEQFGCRLTKRVSEKADELKSRQMLSVELENRQKLWRWLILAAIGVLIVETWLAGWFSRSRSPSVEAVTT